MRSSSAKTSAVAPERTMRPSAITTVRCGVLGDELHVVRHDEDRSSFVVELAQQREQFVGARPVLAESRLIEGENRRAGDERSADRETPLLAARQQERMRARLLGQAESLEQRLRALAHLVVRKVALPQTVGHLVEDRVGDELVLGVLEDEADPRRQGARVAPAHVEIADPDRAAGRRDDARDRLDERRLACAVGAHHRDELPGSDGEVDRREGRASVRAGG